MNYKKLSKFQFHFPGLLGTSPMLKQGTKKSLIIGHWRWFHLSDIWSRWTGLRDQILLGGKYSFSIAMVIWERSGKVWTFFIKIDKLDRWLRDPKTNELGISFNLQNNHFVLCYCFHHKSYGQVIYHLYDQECHRNWLTSEYDPRNPYYSRLEGWLHAELLAKGEKDHLK